MSESIEDLIKMARDAAMDERLSDGALYGKLSAALHLQHKMLDNLVIAIRNRDQSEYEAAMLVHAKQVLWSQINWDTAPQLSSNHRGTEK